MIFENVKKPFSKKNLYFYEFSDRGWKICKSYLHFVLALEVIAQLDDAQITKEDMWTLRPGEYIGDAIIHFNCCLQQKRFDKLKKSYWFVSPAVVQFIQRAPIEIAQSMINAEQFEKSKTIFLPMSNLRYDRRAHWSLLIWVRGKCNQFLHFDSMKRMNNKPARDLSEKLQRLFCLPKSKFTNIKTPSQGNSSDCGLYLMAIMNEVASNFKVDLGLLEKINQDYICNFRKCITNAIIDFNNSSFDWEEHLRLLEE